MSGWKRVVSYAIAATFDFLKLIFTFLLFSGPFIAAEAAKMYAESKGVPSWLTGVVWYFTAGGTVAIEVLQPEIAGVIEAFGILMAMVIGFAGGLFMAIWFWIFCKIQPWKKNSSILWMGLGWIASMVPFVNLLPTLSISAWRIVADQLKADREELKNWKAANAQQLEEQNQVRQAQIMQGQAVQALAFAQTQAAANDNEEIPEQLSRAA